MSKGTDRRTVRVAPELWEAAQAVADKNDTTVSDIIRHSLEAYTVSDLMPNTADNFNDEP